MGRIYIQKLAVASSFCTYLFATVIFQENEKIMKKEGARKAFNYLKITDV